MEQQLVGFLRCCFRIVACDGYLHVCGNYGSFERLHFPEHVMGDRDRIGAGALGDAQRHRCLLGRGVVTVEDVIGGFFRAIHHIGHVLQINRSAAVNTDHDIAHVVRILQESAGLHRHLAVFASQSTRRGLPVGLLDDRDQPRRTEIARSEPGRVDQDAQLPPRAADQLGFGDLLDLLHRVVDLRRQTSKRQVIVSGAVECKRQNRHVVDGAQLNKRLRSAVRDAVKVRLQFLVKPDETFLGVGADHEPHNYQALAGTRSGVDIFHAGNFPEQFFHWARHALLGFLRAGTWHSDEHVHHRHFDLRLLLAR